MENEIKNKTLIHVDLAPNRNEVYSGICLKANGKICILIHFNDESGEFDGYAIIRDYEIEKYREWDDDELSEIKNNNASNYFDKFDVKKANDIYQCLSQLKQQQLISVFIDSDDDSFYVGHIEKISKEEIELKLIDENAEWIENEKILIKEITYIGFESSYEKELLNKNALQNNV